jgi:hypothetical protein
MQNEGDEHEMPFRPLIRDPAGLGMCCLVHRLPFHRSAKVPARDPPTAKQADRDGQESALKNTPGAVGMG